MLGKGLFITEGNRDNDGPAVPVDFIQPRTFVPSRQQRVTIFYKAPLTQFLSKAVCYLAFLVVYTAMVIRPLSGPLTPLEIVVLVWVLTFALEFVLKGGLRGIISHVLKEVWHQLDMASYLLTFAAVVCRLAHADYDAKVCYAIGGILYYIRLLNVFSVHPRLGPLITILGRMISDIAAFFSLFFIVVTAFGVAFKGLLMQSDPTSAAANEAISRVYFNLYGKLFYEDIVLEPVIVEILFAIYMVVAVILLLTLLVAMLTSTYELIRVSSNTVWLSQYHAAIIEIKTSAGMLPPPFSFFQRIYNGIVTAYTKISFIFHHRQYTNAIERQAAQLFVDLDVFQSGLLHRIQIQQIVGGMTKLPSKPPSYTTSLVEHLNSSESEIQTVDQKAFVKAVVCWIEDIRLPPDLMMSNITMALRLFETKWERDERRRVNEFEVQMRSKANASGALSKPVAVDEKEEA